MRRTLHLFATILMAASMTLTACDPSEDNINPNIPVTPNTDPDPLPELTVSTEASKRNVILEEFTGINCGYCPDGHAIANQIMAENPDRVWAINIHQGSFANGRYTTEFGDALADQSGLTGYPSGTVNRHPYGSNGALAIGRNLWASRTRQMLLKSSCVNVAARCVIDTNSRLMTVEVKAYYTSSSEADTNMMNVAVLQNDVLGPQSNYGNFNQAQYDENGKYHHMHMLRHLITGQWGDIIDNTHYKTTFSKTYTYTIPEKISNEDVVLKDLEIVVFVSEGKQEIITGTEAEMIWR